MDANLPIGLNPDDSASLCKELNALLCDLHVFYQNVRGFHWNVQGQSFFELRAKFEEFYTDIQVKIDEVAERVLTLGGQPLHTMQDYVAGATIPAVKDVHDGEEAVRHCAAAIGVLLVRERALLAATEQAGDEGTHALMSDYVREQEKISWMLRAYLS